MTEYVDEWIAEHYPHALFFVDKSGEIGVMLGIAENGESHY